MSPKGRAIPRCMVASLLWLVAGFPLVYRFPRRVPRHRHRAALARRRAVIKLGYKASAEQFAPGKLLGFSCLAEEVGFDSVFIRSVAGTGARIEAAASGAYVGKARMVLSVVGSACDTDIYTVCKP